MNWSYIVWGGWIVVFLVLEFLGIFDSVPWRSLSSTAWSIESLGAWIKVLVLLGMLVLTSHIVFEFPR